MQEQVYQLKGTKVCEECGKDLKLDMSFCPYCGNKQEEEPVEEVQEEEVHAEEVPVENSEPITRETEVIEEEVTPITEEL